MSKNVGAGLCRVVDGIYDTCELDTGFFVADEKIDIVCDWLEAYAAALERAWERNGSEGEKEKQKFAKVRSFKVAIDRLRNEQAV